ncbi:hypothetical protein Nhal_1500 [Nitrosococcus halophilus Nc 4]|uniref:Uncharacterized protein n=1 Tax=Nitrosococcus halophilus (strain Nc4) TaxID=472759 RepID=D5C1L0_NITHN|nr:hypothetical protein [Nitrosococcus halophilus]ADE14643.1 hypothetical protein Nhal_1500 [Nitrosococcus halophilus Nc 4]
MRYREDAITGEMGAPIVNEGMLTGTALYALLVGIGICIVGIRTGLIWATLMGGSLAGVSAVYLGAVVLGYA